MRGMDRDGLTSLVASLSKPDYSKSALGTVVSLKLTTDLFTNIENRENYVK